MYTVRVLYVKKVLYYMFRHFPRVILPVIPSAVLLGIFYRQSRTLTFIRDYGQAADVSIGGVFGMLFQPSFVYYFVLVPAFFVAVSFSCSFLLTMVYKHFRTGKLSVRMPMSNVNHGLESVMPTVAIIIVTLLAYKALFACVVSLLSEIFVPDGHPGGAMTAIVTILGIATYVTVIYFAIYPLMTSSFMLVYGYTFKDAISEALRAGGKNDRGAVIVGYSLPFVLNLIVSYIMMATEAPILVVAVADVIIQLFAVTYLTLFSIISVFTQQKIERIDLKKLY